MYAQLGNIKFEGVKGFTAFSETFGVNYAQHERIQGKPRLESVGEVLDTISFTMYFHSSFTNPEEDIQAVKTAMRNKEILTLVLGTGAVVGNFVIPNFTKVTQFTDDSGNIIEATLSVELLEAFSENPLKQSELQAKDGAFATSSRNSNIRVVQEPVSSIGMQQAAAVSNIQASGTVIMNSAASVKENFNTAEYYSGKINSSLDFIESKIELIEKIQEQIPDSPESLIPQALAGLYSSVQNMKAELPISNLLDFSNLLSGLSSSISYLKKASSPNINQTIIRRL